MSNKTIYDALVAAGMTREGACGFMGNLQAESGLEACRLQGDFTENRSTSRAYVAAVTNGMITRQQFGSDQKGFGLAQWTYVNKDRTTGRKFDLYDFWQASGEALDSEAMQIRFALQELRTLPEYAGVWAVLTASHDLRQCTEIVCSVYENPAVKNFDARVRFASQIFEEMPREPEPAPADPQNADPVVRMLQCCMAHDGAWPQDRIDGVKTDTFREAFVQYAADVSSC